MSEAGESTPSAFEHGVADALRDLRRERGLSTRQLAALAGVSQTTLSNIENGRARPSVVSLYALADALGVGPARLLPPDAHGDDDAVPHGPDDAGTHLALLHADAGALETYRVRIPADTLEPMLFQHPGEDIVHIIEGHGTLMIGERHLAVSVGDTIWLDGTAPHRFHTGMDAGLTAIIVTVR